MSNNKEGTYLLQNCKATTFGGIFSKRNAYFCFKHKLYFPGNWMSESKKKKSGKPTYFSKSSPANLFSHI